MSPPFFHHEATTMPTSCVMPKTAQRQYLTLVNISAPMRQTLCQPLPSLTHVVMPSIYSPNSLVMMMLKLIYTPLSAFPSRKVGGLNRWVASPHWVNAWPTLASSYRERLAGVFPPSFPNLKRQTGGRLRKTLLEPGAGIRRAPHTHRTNIASLLLPH